MNERCTGRARTAFAGGCRRALRMMSAMLFAAVLCFAAGPALAHDDDAPAAPPSAESQAAAGRATIVVLSLIAGVGVYYGMQRHRLIHGSNRSPEWDRAMGRNAVLLALVTAVAVGGVCSALSRPPVSRPADGAAAAPPK